MNGLLRKALALFLVLALLSGGTVTALADGESPAPEEADDWADWEDWEDWESTEDWLDWGNIIWAPELSVQVNGEYIDFPDALPEITDGRTMVPFRAAAEAMGYQVGWLEGGVTATDGVNSIAFTVGASEYTLTTPEGSFTGSMDVAPYIRGDRTYVPVRFFGEAMGYQVLWDDYTSTAVLYDREALVSAIDGQFTVLNRWLNAASQAERAETERAAASLAMELTVFDSLDGDRTIPVSGSFEAVANDRYASMDMELELGTLVGFLTETLIGQMGGLDEEGQAYANALENLSSSGIQAICDMENGGMYLYWPELLTAMTELAALEGEELPFDLNGAENIWLYFGADALSGLIPEGFGLPVEPCVGELLVSYAESLGYFSGSIWQTAQDAAASLALLLGDEVFTDNGRGMYTAAYDAVADAEGEGLDNELWWNDVSYLRGSVTLDTVTGAVSADLEARMDSYYSAGVLSLQLDLDRSGGSIGLTVHMRNSFLLELSLELESGASAELPVTAPPKGAIIINAAELE